LSWNKFDDTAEVDYQLLVTKDGKRGSPTHIIENPRGRRRDLFQREERRAITSDWEMKPHSKQHNAMSWAR